MTSGLKTIIYPVTDIAKAKAVYGELLGVEPSMDEPYYVQYNAAALEIGLDPNGSSKGMTAPVTYWHVNDIKESVTALTDAGASTGQEITDFGGRLIATVIDADGNVIGLLQDVEAP